MPTDVDSGAAAAAKEQRRPLVVQDVAFPPVLQDVVNETYDTVLLDEATEGQLAASEGIISVLHGAIDDALFEKMPSLKVVSNFGAGYDHVDVPAAEARGIACGHTPGAVADSTAELGIALLLAAARRVVAGNSRARKGIFDAWWFGRNLTGATLGIVGMGTIGLGVAQKAAAAFGMKVKYFGRSRRGESEAQIPGGAEFCPDLLELCKASDFIVKRDHLPVPVDAVFVNIARGAVVDTQAVFEALRDGEIGSAALDVTDPEPLPEGHPLFDIDETKLILTPHLGTACLETRMRMLMLSLENLKAGLASEKLPYRAR